MRHLTSLLIGLFTLAACGGQTDSSDPGDGTPTSTSTGTSTSTATSSGTGNNCATCPGSVGSHELAQCHPGFPPAEASANKPCNFFVGTSCYVTMDEACGCACPRDVPAVLCVGDGDQFLPGTEAYGIRCHAQ